MISHLYISTNTKRLIKSGFKNVVLMGDHGGGQKQLQEVATKLDGKYGSQGIHVVYCDEVHSKANGDFDKWLTESDYPSSAHAGIPDTSEMLYLGGDRGWVRKDKVKDALGDPDSDAGQVGLEAWRLGGLKAWGDKGGTTEVFPSSLQALKPSSLPTVSSPSTATPHRAAPA